MISDPIGPAGTDPELSLLVVSEETQSGGAVVNNVRLERKLNPLKIFVVPLLFDEKFAILFYFTFIPITHMAYFIPFFL